MKSRIFTSMVILLLPVFALCQTKEKQRFDPDTVNFKIVTEQEARYVGTEMELYTYFFKNIKYNADAKLKRVKGSVIVSFDVMPDSTLTNVRLLNKIGYGLDEQIVELTKKLKYVPTIQNSKAVKSNMMLTVPVAAY